MRDTLLQAETDEEADSRPAHGATAGSAGRAPEKEGQTVMKGSLDVTSPLAARGAASADDRQATPWWQAFLLFFFSGVSWVASIPILLVSLSCALAPTVGFLWGFVGSIVLFCICVQFPDQRIALVITAIVSASFSIWSCNWFAMLMGAVATAMVSLNGMKRTIPSCPRFLEFQCRAYASYHRLSTLSGALDSIRPGQSFFACHPHGILSVGWISNVIWSRKFHLSAGRCFYLLDKTLRNKGLLAKLFCDAFEGPHGGFRDNSAKTIKELMAKGETVCMTPGAFQEATAFVFKHERVYLQKRRGFIKYCLRYGYRLHPVYTFGETETFYTCTGCEQMRFGLNDYGIPTVMFFGFWLCPFMPRRNVEMRTFVGEPIELPQIDEPTNEQVAEWHGKYVEALVVLFDRHKAEAGRPDAVLEVL